MQLPNQNTSRWFLLDGSKSCTRSNILQKRVRFQNFYFSTEVRVIPLGFFHKTIFSVERSTNYQNFKNIDIILKCWFLFCKLAQFGLFKKKKKSKEVNLNRAFFKKNLNEDEHNLHFNRMNQFLNEKHRKMWNWEM